MKKIPKFINVITVNIFLILIYKGFEHDLF